MTRQDIGLARSFQCQNTVAYCGSDSIGNSGVTVPVGSTVQGIASLGPVSVDLCFTTFGNCNGSTLGTAPTAASWSSSNPQVASTPSGLDAYPQITGVAPGTASFTGQVPADEVWDPNTRSYYYCPVQPQYGTANVNCAMPTAETTAVGSQGWCRGCVGASFMMTLTGTGDYSGRKINEQFPSLQDTCYFTGSQQAQYNSPDQVRGGDEWTVGTGTNQYGADMISAPVDWSQYYQNQIKNHLVAYTSCYVNVVQQMVIDNCQGSMVPYGTAHDTKNTIESTLGRAQRAEAQTSGPIGN